MKIGAFCITHFKWPLTFATNVPSVNTKTSLVLLVSWRRQGTGHYPNEWWPSSLTYVCVYMPQRVNSSWTWITTRKLFHWKSLRIFVLIAFTLFNNAYFLFKHITKHMTWFDMMTSSNEGIFRAAGPLRGEFTGHRWIPLTGASDAELSCFLWSPPD